MLRKLVAFALALPLAAQGPDVTVLKQAAQEMVEGGRSSRR